MPHLPALITSGDVMPGGGDLNGRRWAGHQLLRAWVRFAGDSQLALAHADPKSLLDLQPFFEKSGFQGQIKPLGLVHPQPFRECGGLFLPDPSIGRWAQWRQPAGADAFSLIGQIHTISTPTALGFLQDLLTDPVQSWDALVCSSTAGRDVVQEVLDVREQQLLERLGVANSAVSVPRPQLPVIPLPPSDRSIHGARSRRRGQTGSWFTGELRRCALARAFVIAYEVGSLADISDVGTGGSTFGATSGFGRVWPR